MDLGKMENFIVPSSAAIGAVERAMDAFCRERNGLPESLLVDFSNCAYIEIVTLLWTISILSERVQSDTEGLKTFIRLPKEKVVRDFLTVWEFPAAVRDATGYSFSKFLLPDDQKLFDREGAEGLDKLTYAGKTIEADGMEQRLLSQGFFEISTFVPLKTPAPDYLAGEENTKWKNARIVSVLNKHLQKAGKTVASHIVHEAIMNAVRHPKCKILQTTSLFDRPKCYLFSKKKFVTKWRVFLGKIIADSKRQSKTPGFRIFEFLPKNLQQVIISSEGKKVPLRKEFGDHFLDAINEILGCPDFYDEDYFQEMDLTLEMKDLIRRRHRGLTPFLVEKLNRLLVEKSFPDSMAALSKGYLTITYWDDGDSVVETLVSAIENQKPIKSIDASGLYMDYKLDFEDEEGSAHPSEIINSSFVPSEDTPEEHVVLTATFPGITCDVTGKNHVVADDVKQENPLYASPGMGLYVLVNQSVEVFGGTVSLRTKDLFMHIESESYQVDGEDVLRYAAKVKRYGKWVPKFKGNLLTIRLPLR